MTDTRVEESKFLLHDLLNADQQRALLAKKQL